MNSLTRRDLLATFLGVPAALAGCSTPDTNFYPDGQIVGASDGIGHRLRDGFRPVPRRWQDVGVVIVGGGIAGLSTAWRLLRAGFKDFVVLELEKESGGTSRYGSARASAYPWGAHYVPAPLKENRLLTTLLDEMEILEGRDEHGEPVVAEQYLCRDPHERVYFRGRWYEGLYLHVGESPEDIVQYKAFRAEVDRWVAWRDGRGRRAFAIPMASGSDDPEVTALDRLTMAEWLDRHGWISPRLRWLVNYACRDDYGTTADQTSAWAGMHYFASRLRRPGAEAQPLMTWPEGNGRIVKHLHGKAAERVRLGYAVADIIPVQHAQKEGVDVVAVDHAGQDVLGFHAERVIFAAPHFMTRYVIRPYRENPPRHVVEFEYGSWMVANLFLKDRPASRGFPMAWDNVLYESPSLGYVVATHQGCRDHGPTIWTYYYPLCEENPRAARDKLLGTDWRAWAEVVLTDLRPAHAPLRTMVERLDVMRWGHAIVRPRPGFVWGSSRLAASRPFRGIHFAHADLSGLGLCEEALYHGVRAAEEVLAARDIRTDSML